MRAIERAMKTKGALVQRARVGVLTVKAAAERIAKGEIVALLGEAGEGCLVLAAECATPEHIAFLLRYTSGLICVALPEGRADELKLPFMAPQTPGLQASSFAITVDAAFGVSTGISAADRSRTVSVLANPKSQHTDLARPGHVLVMRAAEGGVLERPGNAEAVIDVARIAGLRGVGVLSQLVSTDRLGMANHADVLDFAKDHELEVLSISELVQHRRRTEHYVRRTAEASLPTDWGRFRVITFESEIDGITHLALVLGSPNSVSPTLVSLHQECLCGDVFSSVQCGCRKQLTSAMDHIARAGSGVIIYLRGEESYGIGLGHAHSDLIEFPVTDENRRFRSRRDAQINSSGYQIAVQMLTDIGVRTVEILDEAPLVSADSA